MNQVLEGKEVETLNFMNENFLESDFFNNLLEKETTEISDFTEKILQDFRNGYQEYTGKLMPIFNVKLKSFLKEIAEDFTNFRNTYKNIKNQIQIPLDFNENSDLINSFEVLEDFFTTVQTNNRLIKDETLWNELAMIYEKYESFSFLEQNNFLKNEFFSQVLNETMAKFTNSLLIYSLPNKEDGKKGQILIETNDKNNSFIVQNAPKIKKTYKKRKISSSNSSSDSNSVSECSIRSRSRSKSKKKNPILAILQKQAHIVDLPYLLLNDMCIVGPLREDEFYLAACSNNELFISVWNLNEQNNKSLHASLYGHSKKPFKLIYNENRKLLISAGMEWVF